MIKELHNPHPGEILKTEFLEPLGLSQNRLASLISVPANRIHHIVNGERGITAETDLKLCELFGLSYGYFLHLQDLYEIMEAKRRKDFAKDLKNIKDVVRPQFLAARKNEFEGRNATN